jgi:hypothetical protein
VDILIWTPEWPKLANCWSAGLFLVIDIRKRLAAAVLHDEARTEILNSPRRREAALSHLLTSLGCEANGPAAALAMPVPTRLVRNANVVVPATAKASAPTNRIILGICHLPHCGRERSGRISRGAVTEVTGNGAPARFSGATAPVAWRCWPRSAAPVAGQ